MATLTPQAGQVSLLELANRHLNGAALNVAEVLAETNEFLQDAVFQEANGMTGHTFVQRTALPAGTWRTFNNGVTPTNSQTRKVTEGIGLLEAHSEIDEALYNIAPSKDAVRAQEDEAFIMGLGNDFSDTFVYGDTDAHPERFKGLDRRVTATSAANCIGGGGTGSDTSSAWVVTWGPQACYLVYPPGMPTGITAEDMGRVYVSGAGSGNYWAYQTKFTLMTGLVVTDSRAIQRIANIETAGTTNILDDDDLIAAINTSAAVPGRKVIYMNATIKTQLDIMAKDRSNVRYLPGEFGGREVMTFKGIPIRQMDSIVDTETAIA